MRCFIKFGVSISPDQHICCPCRQRGPASLAAQTVASLVVQTVKSLPAMQENRIRSLGREDPLEKGMATHSSILAWRIPWTKEPGGLQSMIAKSQTQLSDQHLVAASQVALTTTVKTRNHTCSITWKRETGTSA